MWNLLRQSDPRVPEHAAALQVGDLILGIAEIMAEHFGVMFAEKRCFKIQRRGKVRKAERETRQLELPEDPVVHLADGAALAQMRMVDCLLYRQHWRAGHPMLAHRGERGRVARQRSDPAFDFV